MAITNLAELAEASAERLGEHVVFEIDETEFTNWQLLDRARRLHAAFADLGLARGQRAVVVMMNHALVYPVFQGIFRAGATAVPIMPQAAASELRYVLSDTESQVVITDAERLPMVREAAAGLPHVRHILVQGGRDSANAARSVRRALETGVAATAGVIILLTLAGLLVQTAATSLALAVFGWPSASRGAANPAANAPSRARRRLRIPPARACR